MMTLLVLMMEDSITLDHINTQTNYDLSELYNNEFSNDDVIGSPYNIIDNTCEYYEPNNVKELLAHENNSLSMFCLNTQGLRAHWDSFTNLIDSMNSDTSTNSFDIIGITELYSMSQNECSLNGYHPIEFRTRNDTTQSRGGVAIYIRENLQYSFREDLSIFIPHIFESIFIEVHKNNKTIIIGTMYRPNTPPKADLDIFMHTMSDLVNILKQQEKDIYISGDVNIDLLRFPDNVKTNDYLEDILSHGFIPLITKPTRVTPYSATLIDHIYVNKQEIDATSGIVISDVADHFGIFSILKAPNKKITNNTSEQKFRSYSLENTNTFNKSFRT